MNIRETAVAGSFYEADEARLRRKLASLLDLCAVDAGRRPEALIVPHAGYTYSGALAAQAYATLGPHAETICRVVLLGPAHRVPLRGMALPDADTFATPLGNIPLDQDALRMAGELTGMCVAAEAHRLEHSLEVQLPFLQAVLDEFTLVPIVVGQCDATTVAAAVDALWGGPETLVIVSTDLSHFHNYEEATRRDTRTCGRVLAKDASLRGEDACGAYALNGLLASDHARHLQVVQLGMCNSADTASRDAAGSRDRVVGYGAFLLH